MVQYKLNYFDVRGLGETARLLLTYGKLPFEDRRWGFEEWPAIKPTAPTGKAPWLEIDGQVLTESSAISRYLAKKVGLAGKCDLEAALVDAAVDTYRDFLTEVRPFFMVVMGRAEGDKDQLRKDVFLPAAERTAKWLEGVLAKSGSGFLVKSGLTWGDFFLAESLLTFKNMDPEFAKTIPKLIEYEERVHSVPEIKEYVAKRKVTNI